MNELLFFLEIVLTFGCVVAAKKIFWQSWPHCLDRYRNDPR